MPTRSKEYTSRDSRTKTQEYLDQILVQTPREIASREGKRLKKVIDKFDDSLNQSKTQFRKIHKSAQQTEDYFSLAMDDIEF